LVKLLRSSTQPAFLDTVGWVEYKLGEASQAVLFLEKAVEGAPDAALMHYHLGLAYLASGNKVGAREHLGKAVDGNQNFKGLEHAKKELAALGAE
jgi:Flp pilus assembly protein TadD